MMALGHSPDIYTYTMTNEDNVTPIAWTYGGKDLGIFFTPELKVS